MYGESADLTARRGDRGERRMRESRKLVLVGDHRKIVRYVDAAAAGVPEQRQRVLVAVAEQTGDTLLAKLLENRIEIGRSPGSRRSCGR